MERSNYLGFGQFHKHFCCWLSQLHLLQDGGPIVGNDDFPFWLADLSQMCGNSVDLLHLLEGCGVIA